MMKLLKPKYRIVRYIGYSRQEKSENFVAQRRYFLLFWVCITKPVCIGFSDILYLEVHHPTEEDAVDQIHEDFRDSWYFRLTQPDEKYEVNIGKYEEM